ncbi:Glucose-responsive transcription factor [Orbilia brochopaga]|uniref:Glucose-responsive transcription factor n=1 Tax=Orbilia brochopaga TaxID=3140254 RepID=A0AAV9UT18_9PEZI
MSLRLRLSKASSRVREAFLQALYCAVRSNPASTLIPTGPFESRGVAELAFAAQYEDPASRSIADNLVYLQTLIFLILEADNRGPAAIKGQFGPPRALWLGAAIGLAYNLRLHHGNAGARPSEGDHDDSDEKLGRRAWWTLVVLDRWNAVSTSSPLHIPDSSVVLLQEDQALLGTAAYHITRLSMILGHLAESLTSSDQAASTHAGGAYVSRLLRGELERFRESVDSVLNSLNLVHIAYWHVKLLFLRLNDATEPGQLIGPVTHIATILNSVQTPVTPLSYHFVALAILTLVDLLDYGETRIDAEKGIMLIAEALEARRGVSSREDSAGWDRTIKDFISRRTGQARTNSGATTAAGKHPLPHGNLAHLAELAVGESAGGPGASGMSSEARYPVIDTQKLQNFNETDAAVNLCRVVDK